MASHYSTAPNVLRHWIPLEFSKDVADYQYTFNRVQDAKDHYARRLPSASRTAKLFMNEKVTKKLQENPKTNGFKLIFKNKSCKLFQPKQKIHPGNIMKAIYHGKVQQEEMQNQEAVTYEKLYENDLDKHYIYRYVGLEKPRSSFDVSRRKSTISCDLKSRNQTELTSKQRATCPTAFATVRTSIKESCFMEEKRKSWLIDENIEPKRTPKTRRPESTDGLLVNGRKVKKDQTTQHWKLKKQQILELMYRLRIV